MRRALFATLAALALTAGGLAHARDDRTQVQTIDYGNAALQKLDFHAARGADSPAPLVVFVHGGGWKRGDKDNATGRLKAPHYNGLGYHFATINYRLIPDATVEQQGADVARALAALLQRADALNIDRRRVVLMGHSAGAHLVALVGTDPRYLRAVGLSERDVAGVVPIDGAAYDVAAQMTQAGRYMLKTYTAAFGTEPSRQAALSPALHSERPNAPAFLILHVGRDDGIAQARTLEHALAAAGTPVERRAFAGDGLKAHMEINRRLGDPDYPATGAVDAWLARVFR